MSYLRDEYAILTGAPDEIRGQVRELARVARSMTSMAARLREISVEGVWESAAGLTFAARIGTTPQDLDDVADRLDDAADVMRPYATHLESSQRAMRKYDRDAAAAKKVMDARDVTLAAMVPDDPDRPRVQRERGEAAADLTAAERDFARVGQDAYEDEQRVAGRLEAIQAPLTDPRGYDALEGLEAVGRLASDVGIIAKPVALAGVAQPLGAAGRRAFYDEGSWSDVGTSGLTYGADVVTLGVGRAAKGARTFGSTKAVSRVDELPSKPIRIKDNPIAQAPVLGRRARITKTVKEQASTTLKKKSGMKDVEDAFNDWEEVAGRGRVAKVSVVIEHSAKTGRRVMSNTKSANSALQNAGLDNEETQRRREKEAEEARRRETASRVGKGVPEDPRQARLR